MKNKKIIILVFALTLILIAGYSYKEINETESSIKKEEATQIYISNGTSGRPLTHKYYWPYN